MTADEIINYCLENLDGVMLVNSWGERGIFYNPENKLKRGVYILTVKEKDGENDSSSNLNKEWIYRVNLGVRKQTFLNLFGHIPARPPKGGIVDMDFDFTETDKIMPHPVYGWMSWLCCLNPSAETFEKLKPLIAEAHAYAQEKFEKRKI
ncbi:MAG: hypothetical protein K2N23_07460 [Clostridia bacterium]|nr:hypothetical protein [Clostridia bacterium]